MRLQLFNYKLPQELIAQSHAVPRDHSRLMILGRQTGTISDHFFYELPEFLREGDVLVISSLHKWIRKRIKEGGRPEDGYHHHQNGEEDCCLSPVLCCE